MSGATGSSPVSDLLCQSCDPRLHRRPACRAALHRVVRGAWLAAPPDARPAAAASTVGAGGARFRGADQAGCGAEAMSANLEQALIYHITDVENLPGILTEGGLHSDAMMAEKRSEEHTSELQSLR